MANMTKDVIITNIWEDAHDITSLTAGAAITIQNKGPHPILVFVSNVSPATNEVCGWRVLPNEKWQSEATDQVWIRNEESGRIPVCIQLT